VAEVEDPRPVGLRLLDSRSQEAHAATSSSELSTEHLHHKEAPMIRVSTSTTPQSKGLHKAAKTSCTHSRLVNDVLTATGTKTGQLVCIECKAVFPDPTFQDAIS
jgi:hypothetical protein